MTRLFIPHPLEGRDVVIITGPEHRYLCTVLRVRPGEEVVVFDGSGWEYLARFESATRKQARLVIVGKSKPVATESALTLIVAQALLKAEKMTLVVQKAVELGATEFFPFASERAIPVLVADDKRSRVDRWTKVAQEASRQCGRTRPMKVGHIMSFDEVLSLGISVDLALVCSSQGGEGLDRIVSGKEAPKSVLVTVGPEGGFSERELSLARAKGFVSVSLGPRILRAETAAIIATGLVQHRFGDLR